MPWWLLASVLYRIHHIPTNVYHTLHPIPEYSRALRPPITTLSVSVFMILYYKSVWVCETSTSSSLSCLSLITLTPSHLLPLTLALSVIINSFTFFCGAADHKFPRTLFLDTPCRPLFGLVPWYGLGMGVVCVGHIQESIWDFPPGKHGVGLDRSSSLPGLMGHGSWQVFIFTWTPGGLGSADRIISTSLIGLLH